MLVWIILATVVVLALLATAGVIGLRASDRLARDALADLDMQLARRADLAPDLVEQVKGYAAHERGVFGEAAAARGDVLASLAGSVERRAAAQTRLDHALADVMAVAEAYPDLTASASFQRLQAELSDTEERLSLARQDYNAAVRALHHRAGPVPWPLLTRLAGVQRRSPYDSTAPHEMCSRFDL